MSDPKTTDKDRVRAARILGTLAFHIGMGESAKFFDIPLTYASFAKAIVYVHKLKTGKKSRHRCPPWVISNILERGILRKTSRVSC